jgi:hypothetical protein
MRPGTVGAIGREETRLVAAFRGQRQTGAARTCAAKSTESVAWREGYRVLAPCMAAETLAAMHLAAATRIHRKALLLEHFATRDAAGCPALAASRCPRRWRSPPCTAGATPEAP